MPMKRAQKPRHDYAAENRKLKLKLKEAEQTLAAIRRGEVDALVVDGSDGERIYKIETADSTYRRLVETMSEGAATAGADGTLLYCNPRLAEMLGLPVERIVGTPLLQYIEPADQRAIAALVRNCRRRAGRAEARLASGNGSLIPVQITCGPLDRAGAVCLVFTDLTDLTAFQHELEQANSNLEKSVALRAAQLEKSNRALKENFLKYRGLFEAIRESFALFEAVREADGKISDAVLREGNAALAREAGANTVAAIKGKTATEIYGGGRAAEELAVIREALESGRTRTVETRDEERGRDYLKTFVPLDADRCLVAGPDVTALKEAERRAVQSEERLAQIFQSSPVGIFVSRRADGFLFEVNRAFLDIFGFTEEEVIGRTSQQLGVWLEPGDREKFVRAVNKNGWLEAYDVRLRRKNDTVMEARISLVPIDYGEEACFLGTVSDVTAQKRAEEALRAAHAELETKVEERTAELNKTVALLSGERQRFHDVLDVLPAYVVLLAPDHHVPFANKFFIERFGDSGGKRCYEYLFGRDAPCDNCESYEVLKTNASKTWDWIGPDGRNYSIFDFPFTDADGRPLILEMGLDVTDRLRAEAELAKHRERLEELVKERTGQLERANARLLQEVDERRRAEDRLRFQASILDAVSDAVVGTDKEFLIVYWNKGAERLYGWTAGEVIGRPTWDVLRSEISEAARKALYGKLRDGQSVQTELVQPARDGRNLITEGYLLPVRDAEGAITGFAGVNRDITERKQAEAKADRYIAELRAANEELSRFNRSMVGRELRMVELKKEVNELRARAGQPPRYAPAADRERRGSLLSAPDQGPPSPPAGAEEEKA
jgi:PAS domain S-box-containing protein